MDTPPPSDANAESTRTRASSNGSDVDMNDRSSSPRRNSKGGTSSWRAKLQAKLANKFDAETVDTKGLTKQEAALVKLQQKVEAEERAKEKAVEVAAAIHDCYRVERTNMLNMVKIGIKTLIESSIGFSALGETHNPLKQFCTLIEKILLHGLKEGKSIREKIATRKGLWGLIESFEVLNPEVIKITADIKLNALFKTNIGRARAFIRLGMEKKLLPDIMRGLVMEEMFLSEWYEQHAFMVTEDAMVFSGLLVSLNTIEYSFDIDPFMLDGLPATIDYSLYLKDGNYLRPSVSEDAQATVAPSADGRFSEASFIQLQNQKSVLEEKNRTLALEMQTIKDSRSSMENELTHVKDELSNATSTMEDLDRKKSEAVEALEALQEESKKRLESQTADIEVERKTYAESKEGLNEMYAVMQKQLDTERVLREDVEAELNRILAIRKELDERVASQGQELDRQKETVSALRDQLKEVKGLNLTMLTNVQDAQLKVKDAEAALRNSEKQVETFRQEQQDLTTKLQEGGKKRQQLESTILELSSRLQDVDSQRAAMETNLSIERQYRSTLQQSFDQEKIKNEKVTVLEEELDKLRKEHAKLQMVHEDLQRVNEEQEKTLVEMGSQFSEEKLKLNEIEGKRKAAAKNTWQGNAEVTHCKLCTSAFGLTRRRHHCRNCGGIFCNDCSDNKMPLASSAKAVRVCDGCQSELLKQMTL